MDMSEEEFLNSYDSSKYEKPSVTVDVLIFTIFNEKNDKKILLKGDADSFMSRKLDEHFKTELLDLASLITLKSNKVKVRLTCACDKDLKIVRLAKSRMCVEGVSVSIDPKDFKITASDVL